MNNKHRKTLEAIFLRPTLSNIRWKDIESLLINIGCEISEGNGSRVRFKYLDFRMTFHRPHPSPYTSKCTVNDIRNFLINIGVCK